MSDSAGVRGEDCALCGDMLTAMTPERHAYIAAAYTAVLKVRSDKVVELMQATTAETTADVMLFKCPLEKCSKVSVYCWTCLSDSFAQFWGQSKNNGGANKNAVKCIKCNQTVSHRVPTLHSWKKPDSAVDISLKGAERGADPREFFCAAQPDSFDGFPTMAERQKSENDATA